MKGSLPSSWGNLPSLVDLELGGSSTLTGTLPAAWASPTSFQQLQSLRIHDTAISAAVPASWGSKTAFPQLVELAFINNWPLSGQQRTQGDHPAETSDRPTQQQQSLYPPDGPTTDSANQHDGAWPRLEALILYNSSLRGSIPPSWGQSGIFPVIPCVVMLLPAQTWFRCRGLACVILPNLFKFVTSLGLSIELGCFIRCI